MAPRQGPGSAPQIIRPVPHRPFFHLPDVPLRPLGKLKRRKLHHTVFLWPIGNGNPLINGKPRDLPKLMITVRPHRTHPVGAEGHSHGVPTIKDFKRFLTTHPQCLLYFYFFRSRAVSHCLAPKKPLYSAGWCKSHHFARIVGAQCLKIAVVSSGRKSECTRLTPVCFRSSF